MVASFVEHVAFVSAAFAIKVVVTKFLGIRARLMSGLFRWPEDEKGLTTLLPIVSVLLFTKPLKDLPVTADVREPQSNNILDKYTSLDVNNTENEPFFLFAALALAHTYPNIGVHAIVLLYVALGTRVLHSIALINSFQPFRTLLYLPCLLITLYFAIRALIAN